MRDDKSNDEDLDRNNGKEDDDEGDDYEMKGGNREHGFDKRNDDRNEYDNERNDDYSDHRRNDKDDYERGRDDRNGDDNDDLRRRNDEQDDSNRRNDEGDFSDREDEGHWNRRIGGKKGKRGKSEEDKGESRSDAMRGSQLRSGGMSLSTSNLILFSVALIIHRAGSFLSM